jgi:hypothetical protein
MRSSGPRRQVGKPYPYCECSWYESLNHHYALLIIEFLVRNYPASAGSSVHPSNVHVVHPVH